MVREDVESKNSRGIVGRVVLSLCGHDDVGAVIMVDVPQNIIQEMVSYNKA